MEFLPNPWGEPVFSSASGVSQRSTFRSNSRPSEQSGNGTQHTQQPIMTGTSVLAVKYDKGVMMAADTLGSYGSLARFRDIRRLQSVGTHTIIGAGGDLSDWQQIQHLLSKITLRETIANDSHTLTTAQVYEYLGRVMYNRRSKMNPYWNSMLVGGLEKGEPFLGYVDLLGVTYSSPTLATGFGGHLAQPLLRKAYENAQSQGRNLSETEARELINTCMKVLFYRDARSLNRFQIATVTAEGATIEEPTSVPTSWDFAEKLRGYGPQTQ